MGELWHLHLFCPKVHNGNVESGQEFMKGYTTTGVVLCVLLFHLKKIADGCRRGFDSFPHGGKRWTRPERG